MRTFTADEARTRFGQFIDAARKGPVRVMRQGRVVGVMVSPRDYEAMRAFYADRLRRTLCQSAEQARQQGLTSEMLDELLADES